ncbi:MAG: carbon-nitrogen hydrolase family protein [Bryobacteraceae bacterium]
MALILGVAPAGARGGEVAQAPEGWKPGAARDEIRPRFSWAAKGGPGGTGVFVIETGGREGLAGFWSKTFPVSGGRHYRFRAYRRGQKLEWPQQSAIVRIRWTDAQGNRVLDDRPLVEGVLPGFKAWAPYEYPRDTGAPAAGWQEVAAVNQAPSGARQAVVELHLQWARNARVEWSGVELAEVPPPPARKVRLATVHYRPSQGKTPEEKRRQFARFIEQAASQRADLVVLPETLTFYGTSLSPAETAEPMPGPSTEYFGELARRRNLYIVAGLYERAAHLVYNVAVLIGPDGGMAGKFRKVTLPDGEADKGVAPGRDYPVFNTRFGKLGMMVCYDGFFPEVARELTKRGAEVIAWPVWGCNPDLARARAAENHVYLVSSTYEDVSRKWMLSAVWDRAGRTVALARDWGTVAVAEVDLAQPTRWPSLGDFRSKLPRHVPLIAPSVRFE